MAIIGSLIGQGSQADGRYRHSHHPGTTKANREIVTWVAENLISPGIHPLLTVGVFVVTFLAIHPFQDGNGRLSRILTTLLLLKAGYGYVPYSSLESIIEESKEGYYLALRQTQGNINQATSPNWEPWLLFFLRVLQRQKNRLQVTDYGFSSSPAVGTHFRISQTTRASDNSIDRASHRRESQYN